MMPPTFTLPHIAASTPLDPEHPMDSEAVARNAVLALLDLDEAAAARRRAKSRRTLPDGFSQPRNSTGTCATTDLAAGARTRRLPLDEVAQNQKCGYAVDAAHGRGTASDAPPRVPKSFRALRGLPEPSFGAPLADPDLAAEAPAAQA